MILEGLIGCQQWSDFTLSALPGQSCSTFVLSAHGSNVLLYTDLPYASTMSVAVTSCDIALVP